MVGFAAPAVSSAQGAESPTGDQYDPQVAQVGNTGGGGGSNSAAGGDGSGLTDPVGPLPFTGFDVIAMLAVALAVTGLGLALQRAVAHQSD